MAKAGRSIKSRSQLSSERIHKVKVKMRISRVSCIAITSFFLFILQTGLLGASPTIKDKVVDSEKGREIDTYLSRLNKYGFHGSVLVAQRGKVILHNAYGLSQPENGVKWTTATPASIGSVTKQFTAAAIMKLESAGKLSTADLIGKYFQRVPADKKGITIHQLLTHTAGLPDAIGDDFDAIDKDEYLRETLASELIAPPGEVYEYSNVGYSLLAMIVEQVSGMGYEEFLRESFFAPLGMENTGWRIPKWDKAEVAVAHESFDDHNSILDMPADRWNVEGNGGLFSTPSDMYRWYLSLQEDRILTKAAKAKMFTRFVPENEEGSSYYGYGWVIQDTRRGGDVIWHNGGGASGGFAIYQYVKDSAVFIVFTNKRLNGGYPMDAVAITCSQILFGDDYAMPTEVIDVASAKLNSRSGRYLMGDGSALVVTASDGALEIGADGQSAMNALFPSPMAPMLVKYNSKTVELLQSMGDGDFSSAAGAFASQAPLEEIASMLKSSWATHDSLGPLVSVVPHGVRMGEVAEAFVSVNFANGSVEYRCDWMMGECLGFLTEVDLPKRRMLPTSENSFASFSPQSGTTLVRFDGAGSLVLEGPEGETTFKRQNN